MGHRTRSLRQWLSGLLLCAAVSAAGDDGGRTRLYYIFSGGTGQAERSDLALWAAQRHGAALVALDRHAGDALRRVEREGGAWTPVLAERLGGVGDYLLLVDSRGRLLEEAEGPTALADFGSAPLGTEVDESTWGKVKDLFK